MPSIALGGDRDLEPAPLQRVRDDRAHRVLVFDDEDPPAESVDVVVDVRRVTRSPGRLTQRGNAISKVVPSPGREKTSIVAPADSTIVRTVARPMPVPLPGAFVVTNGSKMRSRTS